jgi:methionine-rich copper-binding protein CopC
VRRPGTGLTTRSGAVATALSVAAAALLAAVSAAPASAHASLVRSSPADESSVATAPKTVSFAFDENIRVPSVILVTGANGASVVAGKTSVVDNIVSIRVRIESPGDYTAVYRVVSADGHPVSGRLSFGVGAGNHGGSTDGSAAQPAAAAGHQHETMSTGPPNRVIGMGAALALLGGLGLLTVRRWAPHLWSSGS